jgi:cytochrome P450
MAVAPATPARPLFDVLDPDFIADPYPAYRRLRESAPVWRSPLGFWVLSRHADIAAVLRDPRFGRDFEGKLSNPGHRAAILKEPAYRSLALSMLARDPPDHTRLRGLVSKAFTARRVEALREGITACVDRLIDRRAADRRMDVIAEFARLLPVTVICDLLGIPESDRARFLAGYRVSARLLEPTPLSPQELAQANANTLYNRSYFEELFRRRRREPGDDLISALLAVRDDADGRLTHDELAANVALLFGAGHETTTHLIGNGLLALHRHPAQWALLTQRPALAAAAVEELLRFDSSVQLTSRKAFQTVALPQGTVVERGESVLCVLGAANRDPDVYPEPDTLEITRSGARALAFGGGIHHCLGAQLARIEAEIAFRRLAERLPDLTLTALEHPDWLPRITLRGLARLDAQW